MSVRSCSVEGLVSNLGLYSREARSNHQLRQLKICPDTAKCPLWRQNRLQLRTNCITVMSKLPRACLAAYQNQLVVARPLHSESGEYTSKSLLHSASQSPLPHAWPDTVKILAHVFLQFPLVHRSQVLQLFQCNSYHPSSRGCTPPLSWC